LFTHRIVEVRLGRAANPLLFVTLDERGISPHTDACSGSQLSGFRVASVVCEQEMTARSTPKDFLHWVKRFRRPFLRLVLVTIALFVIVPQMSSVDSDDDGIPDLPTAIAIAANSIAVPSSSTRKDSGPQKIHNTVVLALAATQSHHLEADKSDCVFHDGRSVLQSSCALRC
jgi:hypothetical protein